MFRLDLDTTINGMFCPDLGTTIKYQPYISSKTLAEQSTINRMYRPVLGTTINYQLYVSSRPWNNIQLSTVCYVQTLAQQSTVCFVQDIGTTINYQRNKCIYILHIGFIAHVYGQPSDSRTITHLKS